MTVVADTPPSQPLATGRRRVAIASTNRVRRDGKFFRLGDEKVYVKGVTYGPFEIDRTGHALRSREQTEKDFKQILDLGANCVRIYPLPAKWFLDLAHANGL